MATFKTSQVERERPEDPFVVECDSGEEYVILHPKEVPGRDLVRIDTANPTATLLVVLGDRAQDFLDEPEIDGYALEQIFQEWLNHYGLPGGQGEGRASRRSSTGSAKRSRRTSRSAASR